MNSRTIFSSIIPVLLMACAGNQGTQPNDMSMAQHEQAAQNEDHMAQGHGDQYEPGAVQEREVCSKGHVCWTSRSNPTTGHKHDADMHRDLATKHRAAAAVLAQAEAQSCSGIDEEDRDMSPFGHREDIVSVKEFNEELPTKGLKTNTLKGATVVFRAVPGMTAEWLKHSIDCHLARAASVGYDMPEMSYCPLMLKDVKATVSSAGDGFAVSITSDDRATAEKILSRAKALLSSPGVAAK